MQLLTFKLNKSKYALDTNSVMEIIENKVDISKIPHSESYVEGISNIRGDVIEIINLSDYLNTNKTEENLHIIIAGDEDHKKGLLVDSVEQIVDEVKLISSDLQVVQDNGLFDRALVNKETEDIYLQLNSKNLLNIKGCDPEELKKTEMEVAETV